MKGYILSIICVCIAGSLISILSPDDTGGGISKHIKLIFGLCVILVCLEPIKDGMEYIKTADLSQSILPSDDEADKYEDIFKSSYTAAEVENLKNEVKNILAEKFGIDGGECDVSIGLVASEQGNSLSRVLITLYDSAVWKDTSAIEAHLSSLLGCEVISAIGLK